MFSTVMTQPRWKVVKALCTLAYGTLILFLRLLLMLHFTGNLIRNPWNDCSGTFARVTMRPLKRFTMFLIRVLMSYTNVSNRLFVSRNEPCLKISDDFAPSLSSRPHLIPLAYVLIFGGAERRLDPRLARHSSLSRRPSLPLFVCCSENLEHVLKA